MPPAYHGAVKKYADEEGKILNEAYDEIIDWFLTTAKSDPSLFYLMSPKKTSKYTSLWLSSRISNKVKKQAEKDDVSMNRVVYSAMVHFLKSKNYL